MTLEGSFNCAGLAAEGRYFNDSVEVVELMLLDELLYSGLPISTENIEGMCLLM